MDVEPAVNAALMHAAKDPTDDMIPVSVTSLKSLFFVLTNSTTTNDMNYFKSGFEHCGLASYRVVIGGMRVIADVINVTNSIHIPNQSVR